MLQQYGEKNRTGMQELPNKKYLLISPSYPPPLAGGHKVWCYTVVENCPLNFDILTSDLKEGFDELSSPRHNVIRKNYIFSGKSEHVNPSAITLFISYAYILQWFLKRHLSVKYEVVIAGAFTFTNGILFLLGKLLGVPVIGLGFAEEFTIPLKGKGFKNFVKRNWIKFAHKRAAGFIVVCDFCKEILISIGVDPNKIYVVTSSIDPSKMHHRGKKPSGHKILSVGSLIERKGFHYLIDAVAKLKDELPDITLTIVGKGPYELLLMEQVRRNSLEEHVFIKGFVRDEELVKLYKESDLFVLAHVTLENGDTEGCPTVFFEASGNGLPVIGGTGAGASTIIVEGETGYVVNSRNIEELTDRIRKLLTNPQLAEKMGNAGFEKVRRGHIPRNTGMDFYNSICRIAKITSFPYKIN